MKVPHCTSLSSPLLSPVPLSFPTYRPPPPRIVFYPHGSQEPIILIGVGSRMKETSGGGGGTLWRRGRCDDYISTLVACWL